MQILSIDLGKKDYEFKEIPEEGKNFLGGRGLGAYFLPKSKDNIYIFSGYLTGEILGIPATRTSMCFYSPITNKIYSSSIGGKLGYYLKTNGLIGLEIKGSSNELVDIFIEEDKVLIKSSEYKNQTLDRIKCPEDCTFLAIGPAGERKVLFSCVLNEDFDAFGRGGTGYVFGKKGIKTIFIKKGNYKLHQKPIEKKIIFKLLKNEIIKELKESGTFGMLYKEIGERDLLYLENFDRKKLELWNSLIEKGNSCLYCPIQCKKRIKKNKATEYYTYSTLKTLTKDFDLVQTNELYHLCNVYGLDGISTGFIFDSKEEFFEFLKTFKLNKTKDEIVKILTTSTALVDQNKYDKIKSFLKEDPRHHQTQISLIEILENRKEDPIILHCICDILGLCVFTSYFMTYDDYNSLLNNDIVDIAKKVIEIEKNS